MFEKIFWSRETIETLIYDTLGEDYNRKSYRVFIRIIFAIIGFLAIPYWCISGIVMSITVLTNPMKIKPNEFMEHKKES